MCIEFDAGRLSDVENEGLYRRFTGVDLFLRFIRQANRENVFCMSQNHGILIEWEIFEMNSSELNEPCPEIHQNSRVITATRRRIAGIG